MSRVERSTPEGDVAHVESTVGSASTMDLESWREAVMTAIDDIVYGIADFEKRTKGAEFPLTQGLG